MEAERRCWAEQLTGWKPIGTTQKRALIEKLFDTWSFHPEIVFVKVLKHRAKGLAASKD